MRENQIVATVDGLMRLSDKLERLVGNSDSLHHLKQSKASRKQSEYAKALYSVQRHAHLLFRALRSSWDQTCHPCHEALLRLEARCKLRASRLSAAAGTQTPLTFTTLFPKDFSRADVLLAWHQAQVSMLENHQSETLFPIQ